MSLYIGNQRVTGIQNVGSTEAVWGEITGTLSDQTDLQTALNGKQDTLVSGSNIKTINNNSILGSGNLALDGLPSQTGKSGYLLTTDGTDASWGATGQVYPVVETYNNNGSWYRVYADNWCEMGFPTTSGTAVTLLKTFADTNYTATCAYSAKTTTSFTPSATGNCILAGYIEPEKHYAE